MATHWQRVAVSSSLLLLVLVGVAALLSLVAGSVLLPQAGMFVWIALGFVMFVVIQLLVFRLLGLRSRADETPADPDDEQDVDAKHSPAAGETRAEATDVEPGSAGPERGARDADWRAWRG